MYWLKDGKIKITANVSTKLKLGEITGGIRTFCYDYNYFELTYAVTNHTMQGYYQCVVLHPKYMSKEVKSTELAYSFKVNHYIISIHLLLLLCRPVLYQLSIAVNCSLVLLTR